MGKYSKNKIKANRGIKILIIIFSCILVLSVAFLILIGLKNNVVKENIDENAKNVSDDIAKNSTPILINNTVVGATYNNKWVSSERYFFNSINKVDTQVDMYTNSGKSGTFAIQDVKQDAKSIYVLTNNLNVNNEYIATAKSNVNLMTNPITKSEIKDIDYEYAKNALGIYRLFNTSMRITSAYDVTIADNPGRILFVTNTPGKSTGGYSAAIYVGYNGKSEIIKYNYIRNLKKSEDWAIYSLMFVIDLNNDKINEVILQETKEFGYKYSVLEYKNNKFSEVLSSDFKI